MIIKQPSRAFLPNNYINGIFFKLALSDRSPHNSIIFIECFQKIPEIAFMSAINNNFVQRALLNFLCQITFLTFRLSVNSTLIYFLLKL